jgi:uncharacterized membrane protein YdbT with pleckstrin-like domain
VLSNEEEQLFSQLRERLEAEGVADNARRRAQKSASRRLVFHGTVVVMALVVLTAALSFGTVGVVIGAGCYLVAVVSATAVCDDLVRLARVVRDRLLPR